MKLETWRRKIYIDNDHPALINEHPLTSKVKSG